MSPNDAQHSIAAQKVSVDRASWFVPGNSEVDRPSAQHRKVSENGIAETPVLITRAGAEDDQAPSRLAQIGPLIGMAPGAAARIDFLQTSDIGVDFSQH